MLQAWPLVGRADELARVIAYVADPPVTGVIVEGPAGIGKSRLLQETRTRLTGRGHTVWSVVGTAAGRQLPFAAFAHLRPEVTPDQDPIALLRTAADRLCAGTSRRRVVVIIDDADQLDDASAVLANHMAHARRAFLLISVRTGREETLDRWWRGAPATWISWAATRGAIFCATGPAVRWIRPW